MKHLGAHAQGFGKTADEIVGLHISEIMPAATLPEILPKVAQALSGESVTFETQRSLADGTEHFYEIHYIPDFHESEVRGIFIEMNDVTERRRIEEMVLRANHDLEERVRERSAELFESEQRYRLMVDALQDYCIYFIDENGVVTDWTESAQRLHGFSRQRWSGKRGDVLLEVQCFDLAACLGRDAIPIEVKYVLGVGLTHLPGVELLTPRQHGLHQRATQVVSQVLLAVDDGLPEHQQVNAP